MNMKAQAAFKRNIDNALRLSKKKMEINPHLSLELIKILEEGRKELGL